MRIVIAVGGNSLIQDKDHILASDQYNQIEKTNYNLLDIYRSDHELVITHGNGPQVGFLLNMSELAEKVIPIFPLDYCVANTQGSIGYQIQNSLDKILNENNIPKQAVTLITQVVVDPMDEAFIHPTKPIGSFYSLEEIQRHATDFGWNYVEDSGRGYRRVVPSPKPLDIVEKDIIVTLLKEKYIVIAVGGGGIPVIVDQYGLKGVEAVIDKDFASSLLANEINADLFIISTAVDCAYINFNEPRQRALREVHVHELESYLRMGFFGKGSMEPKIQAVIEFTKKTGKRSIITSPELIKEAIEGKTGTSIIP
jgi:carbamate kinase